MNDMDKQIKPWRINYTVSYLDKAAVRTFQAPIHAILQNVAWLREIECKTVVDYPFFGEDFFERYPDMRDTSADLIYFRSTRRTAVSRTEFRQLVDHIFDRERDMWLLPAVEVGPQLLKFLPDYPFPKD